MGEKNFCKRRLTSAAVSFSDMEVNPLISVKRMLTSLDSPPSVKLSGSFAIFCTTAYNVVLNHHEKWNGKGYPGLIAHTSGNGPAQLGHGKKEDEIPLEGRITAIADVYDALSSRRTYKDVWPEEKITDLLLEERGEAFDPELIDIFFDIHEVILAIKERYQDWDVP